MPLPGEIVLFRHRRTVRAGTCENVGRGGEVRVSTEEGRAFTVPSDRMLYTTGILVKAGVTALRSFCRSAEECAEEIDLEEIWRAFEGDESALTFQDIAELYWEEDLTPLQYTAMVLHLNEECPYFERRAERYVPASQEALRAWRDQRERRQERHEEEERFVEWLRSDRTDRDLLSERARRWLDRMCTYVLREEEDSVVRRILDQLRSGASGDPTRYTFNLLVSKGIWGPDEYLDLIRREVPVEFPENALQAVEEIDLDDLLKDEGFRDLTHLHVFSIDDETTEDIDDALSLEILPEGYRVGVHITAVGASIPKDSPLDLVAAERMSTLYLPERKIRMLPARVSEELYSLVPDEPRLALSFLIRFDPSFSVQEIEIVPSRIINRNKLSYTLVEQILGTPDHPLHETMVDFSRIAMAHRERRLEAGAVEIVRPELRIRVDASGEITIERQKRETEADRIVAEMMILANSQAAQFCFDHDLPAIYRTQIPADLSGIEEIANETLRRYRLMGRLAPMGLSVDPQPHALLGIDLYCQATSPLRRYTDLMAQRQILHYLAHQEPLYTQEEISSMIGWAGERLRDLGRLEGRRKRYWLYKYLSRFRGEIFSATVLESTARGALIEVEEYLLRTLMRSGASLTSGDTIDVRLERVDPWDNTIQFVHVPEKQETGDRRQETGRASSISDQGSTSNSSVS